MRAISVLKFSKSCEISENKLLHLFKENKRYFVELIANGYAVRILAGTSLKKAEKRYLDLINKVKEGKSMLESVRL